MAFTNKGLKWEIKNSIYMIFSPFAFLKAICFFHMGAKANNKKWKRMGWIVLGLNIFLVIALFMFIELSYAEPESVPYDTMPSLEDYLGRNYYEKYGGYEVYSKLPEYEQYLDAVDEWRKDNEVEQIRARNEQSRERYTAISTGVMLSWFLTNLIAFFYLISERANYLRMLAQNTDKKEIISRLDNKNNILNNKSKVNKIEQKDNFLYGQKTQTNLIQNDVRNTQNKIDINIASEKELTDLPVLTAIDAKRAIIYREHHKGFNSVDEFFQAINAKPHVIVKLENIIFVSESYKEKKSTNKERVNKEQPQKESYNMKRRIDL